MKRIPVILLIILMLTGCGKLPSESEIQTKPNQQPSGTILLEPTAASPTQPPATEAPQEAETVPTVSDFTDFKGIWLSQFDLKGIYQENGAQRDKTDFTNLIAKTLDNIKRQGFNTVMLQVRPNGDSMYPSAYYPMSKYVVGEYGREATYDPVAIFVELAKERDLAIHAWINPMRCMSTAELEQVNEAYPIRQWYDDPRKNGTYLVQSGTYWYLNPAYEEVRSLISDGAAEILKLYDFDGLHMDDYFYPTTDAAFDASAYSEMGEGLTLDAFRRNNLSKLVASLFTATKACGAQKLYGISPAGNISTVYERQYADVYTWCSEAGYIDYICPQVYFGLEHQNFDFVSVCNTWQGIIQTDSVDLIIGMTFEKALTREDKYAGSGKNEWKEHTDVLKRCLEYTVKLEKCRGICVFSYQHFFDPVTGEEIAATAAERAEFVPALADVTWCYRGGVG